MQKKDAGVVGCSPLISSSTHTIPVSQLAWAYLNTQVFAVTSRSISLRPAGRHSPVMWAGRDVTPRPHHGRVHSGIERCFSKNRSFWKLLFDGGMFHAPICLAFSALVKTLNTLNRINMTAHSCYDLCFIIGTFWLI